MPESSSVTTISGLPKGQNIGGRSDWGNKLVVNTGLNPVANFAFMLRVEGVFDLPCKAVKGIHRENEFDYIQEGGLNDYVHLKRKPISKPFTFQVERYVGINWVDPLPLGTELTLPVILFVNKHVFPGLEPVRNYVFTGCTVISKDYGELNAEVSGLLLETVTIAYREMVCLDIPMAAFDDKDVWKFDGKKKEGKGDRHYNSNLYNKEWETEYNSAAKMQARAARWTPQKGENGKLKSKYGKDYESLVTDYNKEIEKEINAATTEEEKNAAKAKKIAMSGAVSRLWPEQSSAKKKEMKTPKARQYKHSKTPKQNSSAKYSKEEMSAAKMSAIADSAKWTPQKDENGGLKPKYGRDYETFATNYNAEIEKEIKAAATEEEKNAANAKKIAMSSAASRQYKHSKTPKQNSSAKYFDEEMSAAEMSAIADKAKWTPQKDESGNLKPKYGRDYETFVTNYNAEIQKEIDAASTEEEKSEANAKKIAMSDAANRHWPEQSSAKTKEMETPKGRQYKHTDTAKQYNSAKHLDDELSLKEMEEAAKLWPKQSSAHTKKMKTPKGRQYKHTDTAKQYNSAKHFKDELSLKEMEEAAKLWPKQSSAHKNEMKKPKSKKWPESSSAHTKKMKNTQAKLWPAQKSARREEMKNTQAKLWPAQQSAKREEMKVPQARLWPQARSARQITDFLKNH